MKASPKKKKSLEKLFFLLLIVFSAIPLLGADYFGYLTSPVRHAVLQDTRQDMVARVGGNIRFFFREGQEFKNGDLLASLEMEKRQSTLREADLKLSQMQAILPPSYGGVTENHQSIEEKIETSDLNLRKLRAQEIKNREALEEISLAEARAAVEERRLLSRSRKGYVDYEAMDRAELDHKNRGGDHQHDQQDQQNRRTAIVSFLPPGHRLPSFLFLLFYQVKMQK